MLLNEFALRAWGINRGEEPFLAGGVGMVTGPWCSASCPQCYLRDGDSTSTAVLLPQWDAILAEFGSEPLSALFLVNWEGFPPSLIAEYLGYARSRLPNLPVVLKLGGHEDPDWISAILPHIDAVSLDVKAFSQAAATQLTGKAFYISRVTGLIGLLRREIGDFSPASGKVRGLWLRHVIVPGTTGIWESGLAAVLGVPPLPVWILTSYRPFSRARQISGLQRRLTEEERDSAARTVTKWQMEGQVVWLT